MPPDVSDELPCLIFIFSKKQQHLKLLSAANYTDGVLRVYVSSTKLKVSWVFN